MTRIALHSVNSFLAAGLQASLAGLPQSTLLGSFSSMQGLVGHLRRERPDLLLIEAIPGTTLSTLRELRAVAPGVPIVLWVESGALEFAFRGIRLGVRGILRRSLGLEAQAECLSRVAAGELWVEQALGDRLLCPKRIVLTPRERQLVRRLALGLKNKEIAYSLGITEGCVKMYLSRLFVKVAANDRFDAAPFALECLDSFVTIERGRGGAR